MSPSFLQQLVDRLRQEPRVLAVYVDRGLTAPRTGEVLPWLVNSRASASISSTGTPQMSAYSCSVIS